MFIKALVRKLHLKVFSPGDFAMEEGESGEEVEGGVAPVGRASGPSTYHAISPHNTVRRLHPTYLQRQVYFLSRGTVAIIAEEHQVLRTTTSSYPTPQATPDHAATRHPSPHATRQHLSPLNSPPDHTTPL
jgi:hypothetical protein